MAFALFIGGMFLGTILGFVIMALLGFSGGQCRCEELELIESGFACAYPPSPRVPKPKAFEA